MFRWECLSYLYSRMSKCSQDKNHIRNHLFFHWCPDVLVPGGSLRVFWPRSCQEMLQGAERSWGRPESCRKQSTLFLGFNPVERWVPSQYFRQFPFRVASRVLGGAFRACQTVGRHSNCAFEHIWTTCLILKHSKMVVRCVSFSGIGICWFRMDGRTDA